MPDTETTFAAAGQHDEQIPLRKLFEIGRAHV